MKRWMALLTLLALVGLALPAAQAQGPRPLRGQRKPIRVLLTYGGHGFEEKAFFAMWDGLPGIQYDKAPLPEKAGLLKPGLEKEYDVLVMYDMTKAFTPEQQKNFIALLQTGIGVVAMHHNLGAHDAWPEYHKIIGGKYVAHAETIDGKARTPSNYNHGQEMKITVADAQHMITRRIGEFTIHDESYGNYYVAPGVHVLLTTDCPKNNKEIAWTTQYGKSPVFYYQLGHDHLAWDQPEFRRVLVSGIRWVNLENKRGLKAPVRP